MIFYRIIMTVMWFFLPFIMVWRIAKGKDRIATFLARLTLPYSMPRQENVIWLHAASIGELNTLRLIFDTIQLQYPVAKFLITTSNITALEQIQSYASDRVFVSIAPIDFAFIVKRFLRIWRPLCLIVFENEVYPNRLLLCKKNKISILYINARMSMNSFDAWSWGYNLSQKVFSCIDFCYAQDDKSYDRFQKLGVRAERLLMLGNLKKYHYLPNYVQEHKNPLAQWFDPALTLCVASTHKGEEEIILDAFVLARRVHSNLRLILAPRHPSRTNDIQKLIAARHFVYTARSSKKQPRLQDDIYLADTVGEMHFWYNAANITFVGGSLVAVGGHTPYEPALHNSAIIHGPYYSNFDEIYKRLVNAGGSIEVRNAADISQAWITLLDKKMRHKYNAIAQDILITNKDKKTVLDHITKTLARYIDKKH